MPCLRLIFIVLSCLACGFAASADITRVQVVGDGAPTRITIWSDLPQDARAFLTESGDARSLVLPLNGPVTPRSGNGMGGVSAWVASDDALNFSFDRPMMVARVLNLPPAGNEPDHRVIIDLQTVSAARFSSVARRDMRKLASYQAKLRQAEVERDLAAVRPEGPLPGYRSGKYVVVIDAGHGGKDPGASVITGGVEKDITLKAAKKLKALLESDPRYEVRLTRETDRFIELEDRVTLARNWGANLFISLHADAAARSTVAGASIYTISARGESRIDKEANKNDWHIPLEDGTPERVTGILKDLVKRETKTRSSEFAEMLLPELRRAGPVLRDTHKNAGFYVLLAPDVPAVLVELGFVTNREDAKRLQSNAGLNKSMMAIKRGIDRFFDQQDVLLAGQG